MIKTMTTRGAGISGRERRSGEDEEAGGEAEGKASNVSASSVRPSARTKLSESHTFFPSLTHSMMGGAVSRATERHLSLTTVQDAEAASISLHLRCGSPAAAAAAYSSAASGTKKPCRALRHSENDAKERLTVAGTDISS